MHYSSWKVLTIEFALLLIIFSSGSTSNGYEFIIDYSIHKGSTHLVGFTCDILQDDIILLKTLSKVGVRVAIHKKKDRSIDYLIKSKYHRIGIFLDTRCYDAATVSTALTEASDHRFYNELHYWLIIGSDLDYVLQVVDDQAFGTSTDFTIAVVSQNTMSMELYDVYNPFKGANGSLHVSSYGHWTRTDGLKISLSGTKLSRRSNLEGLVLRTGFFKSKYRPKEVPIEVYLSSPEVNTIDGFSRFGYTVLKCVSEMFNFGLDVKEFSKWEKGDHLGPISRALNNNDIDVTGGSLLIDQPRLKMVKYVYPSWPFRTCFILRSPQPEEIKFERIFHPFTSHVWYLMMAFVLISSIILCVTLSFENDSNSIIQRCSTASLTSIGLLCQQGTDLVMGRISTRVIIFTIICFSYLLFNYYTSIVVSIRLSEPIFKINDSLNELRKTGFRAASDHLIYFDYLMKREDRWETNIFYTERFMKIPEDERFMPAMKGVKFVQGGGFAYHAHPEVVYPFINRWFNNLQICELTEISLARLTYTATAVTYNSTLVELMKVGFARLSEAGIRRRQLNRLTARKPICLQDLRVSSISAYEFAPLLIALLVGIVLALGILIVEQLTHRIHQADLGIDIEQVDGY
ncbi:hypothetical protein QAD02_006606 [Eretmocerus hayati]|uniref:Uncharacterized protein n=1 Tax=Eretmocerus hayati TaxID=131215 RepID=A0ACC2N1B9_9HYME|nr:hypothetical protein QAD02_006606 [Eretmocerus hayati]